MKLFSVISPPKSEFDVTVNKILNRSEYAHLKSALSDFIAGVKDCISQWIMKVMKKVFSNLENPALVSDKLSTVFTIIGLLVILGMVIIIVIKTRLKEILGKKISDKATPYSLRAEGDNFAKEENFRQAARYDFIALLFLMHEKTLLYLDETKTNEEIYNYFLSFKQNG